MGKLYRHDPTGIPKIQNQGLQINDHPRIDVRDPDAPEQPPSFQNYSSFKTNKVNGTVVGIGRNFEGNHLYGTIPADNAIAISDSGLIVSLDNSTIAYFKENGDTIAKYGIPILDWYQDSTFDRKPFDPKIIYDHVNDRFIAVMMYFSNDHSNARILVSFSEPLGLDSVSWNHYQISIDSIYMAAGEELFWADLPNIAINEDELFVSAHIFRYDSVSKTSSYQETLLLQIEKAPGYAGAAQLNCREWENVQNAESLNAGILLPVGEAFQSPNYGPGCFMVSNYPGNSAKFFWYELTGDINDPSAMIVSHLIATGFFYSFPSFATQMGGNGTDRIKFEDCRLHSGMYLNGNLYFVFHRSDNGWGEIVLARINTSSNTFQAETWGGDEESLNSMYPSIAPFGSDSTEEKFLIAFERTGPTIFPELCVIGFDSTWSPSETIVQQGLGLIDQKNEIAAPWDSLERIGDYTSIQRRYNDPQNACWLAGSFAAGPLPNHFGVTDGIKTWIAEVGDSAIVSIPEAQQNRSFLFFPNPVQNNEFELHFVLPGSHDRGSVTIYDIQGRNVFNTNYSSNSFELRIPSIPQGLYFVKLTSQKYLYETQKLLIRR
jgi:hypothetical protein